jgi:acyl-CoA hydrolase
MDLAVVSADAAVARIPAGARIVVSPACGTPTSLLDALTSAADAQGWSVLTGLVLAPELLVSAVCQGALSWRTWHPTAGCQGLVGHSHFGYVPLRASQVPKHLAASGVDVALVRVTPPDHHGWCSLGPSASYPVPALEHAHLRIAEVDPNMPRTWGQTMIHVSRFDLLAESTTPMAVYEAARPDEVSRSIARHLIDLLPPDPVFQLGIGRVPEALVHELGEQGVGGLRFVGMGSDGMVDLAERGLLDTSLGDGPPLSAPDLLGTSRLMDFADDNPSVGVFPSTLAQSPTLLSARKRLVSVNSALEVDLAGQVNAELIQGRRISGVGGSYDFAEAATHSEGGLRVIAVPSTRIVRRLGEGSTVTVPRALVDVVVTEKGAVRLEGLTEQERELELESIGEGGA